MMGDSNSLTYFLSLSFGSMDACNPSIRHSRHLLHTNLKAHSHKPWLPMLTQPWGWPVFMTLMLLLHRHNRSCAHPAPFFALSSRTPHRRCTPRGLPSMHGTALPHLPPARLLLSQRHSEVHSLLHSPALAIVLSLQHPHGLRDCSWLYGSNRA